MDTSRLAQNTRPLIKRVAGLNEGPLVDKERGKDYDTTIFMLLLWSHQST